mmetsp:Transcript_18375/g.39685  ORF Transcript_18375/g.39685 Transcript_18375/m.39685 type:complete len:234 (-) Transcript_18375:1296-1997(-)
MHLKREKRCVLASSWKRHPLLDLLIVRPSEKEKEVYLNPFSLAQTRLRIISKIQSITILMTMWHAMRRMEPRLVESRVVTPTMVQVNQRPRPPSPDNQAGKVPPIRGLEAVVLVLVFEAVGPRRSVRSSKDQLKLRIFRGSHLSTLLIFRHPSAHLRPATIVVTRKMRRINVVGTVTISQGRPSQIKTNNVHTLPFRLIVGSQEKEQTSIVAPRCLRIPFQREEPPQWNLSEP